MNFEKHSPESVGISAGRISRLIDYLDKNCNPHALLVARDGKCVSEVYWKPFSGGKHLLNSFAKSVNVLAVGMAMDEGKLSFSDRPAEMFKNLLPEKYDERVTRITVRDLLRMTSSTVARSTDFRSAKGSWITHYFSYPMQYEPGEKFFYESGASFMLSAMVQNVCGKSVFEIINERIFGPLDIDAEWLSSPEGITVGGWGLSMSLRDMAKLGELFTCGGIYNGKRLLNGKWIEECTVKHSDIDPSLLFTGYGYQFWIVNDNVFAAAGAFGQYAVCEPKTKTFIVIQSGCGELENAHMEKAVKDFFSPECESACQLASEENTLKTEKELSLKTPEGLPEGEIIRAVLKAKELNADYTDGVLSLEIGGKKLRAGFGEWLMSGKYGSAYACAENELVITAHDVSNCYYEKITVKSECGHITAEIRKSVAMSEEDIVPEKFIYG